jgi:hemerythrin superfamily protein
VTISVDQVTSTLTEQHHHIKTMMQTVVDRDGSDRQEAFAELCHFLAAHEAVEEEYIHTCAKEQLDGETDVVDRRIEEEHKAGNVIDELERLDAESREFEEKFEMFRRAVEAHAEAEEREEFPELRVTLDEVDCTWMQEALSRVPELASRNGEAGLSFKARLQAARRELRSGGPTTL